MHFDTQSCIVRPFFFKNLNYNDHAECMLLPDEQCSLNFKHKMPPAQ